MWNNLPVLSPSELAACERKWNLSEEKKMHDAKQEKLKRRIEVLNVGSFSQIDRCREV